MPANLRRFLLVDDAAGATVSTSEGTRDALPGEAYGFAALAEALTRHTGLPAQVCADLPPLPDGATAVVAPAALLNRLLTGPAGRAGAARIAVVDAPRGALLELLARPNVTAAVEHHQYRAWKTGEPADAALYGAARIAADLPREVTVTPVGDGRFARIRVEGDDLPALLADYLAAG